MREAIAREISFKSVRSRGPGGQNVNKVSSSAVLTWDYLQSHVLNPWQKEKLTARLPASVFSAEGHVMIRSDAFRDLEANKRDCLDKLMELVERNLKDPKKRIPTKPTKSSKRRKAQSKQRDSETKRLRSKVSW